MSGTGLSWADTADLRAELEARGFTGLRPESVRRIHERRRIAESLLACQEEHNEHTRAWAHQAFAEQRRLSDRLTFVYGVARAHGATIEELSQS